MPLRNPLAREDVSCHLLYSDDAVPFITVPPTSRDIEASQLKMRR
jgi:hypothetical protein